MDAAERALLEDAARDAVARAGSAGGGARATDDALADLGWREMVRAEPRDAVGIVFRTLGALGASATALDDVVVAALGGDARADLAVLLPRFGAWSPPGRIDGDHLHALGLATARVATASEVLVVGGTGPDVWAVTVPVADAAITPVRGIDPEGGLHTVRVEHRLATAAPPLGAARWDDAVAAGQRALAHQIAGASRAMLDLARTHALERVQFDRPIARFQAVRHRLADSLVAVEALEAALGAAWDEPNPTTAALAKAAAGRTARTVGAHAQQVLAGIGFTTDHLFHRFLKRTMALEGLLGSADELALDLGRRLLATRAVPTLIEL